MIGPLEWVMLVLIIGGGLYLTLQSRARPLFRIKEAFSLLLSKEKAAPGISRFQALSAVLAATVGLGNISGVAIAIHMGGPGCWSGCGLPHLLAPSLNFFPVPCR